MAEEMCAHEGLSNPVCVCESVYPHACALEKRAGGVGGLWGVVGGCHGDSNTPVALPTCLPGPNLLGEGGEEGREGGEAEGSETIGEGGGVRLKRQEKREEKGRVRRLEMEQTGKVLPVLDSFSVSRNKELHHTHRYKHYTCSCS